MTCATSVSRSLTGYLVIFPTNFMHNLELVVSDYIEVCVSSIHCRLTDISSITINQTVQCITEVILLLYKKHEEQ